MTPEQKMSAMKQIFIDCLALAKKKGNDYNDSEDGMKNFRTFGYKGIVVRLEDKMQRLIHFVRDGSFMVKEESFLDTLDDLINYAALARIMYQEEMTNGVNSVPTTECGDKNTTSIHDALQKITDDIAAIPSPAQILSNYILDAYSQKKRDPQKTEVDMCAKYPKLTCQHTAGCPDQPK